MTVNEVKKMFLNGIGPYLYMKKVIFSCIYDNVVGMTDYKTWIEVGLKHRA